MVISCGDIPVACDSRQIFRHTLIWLTVGILTVFKVCLKDIAIDAIDAILSVDFIEIFLHQFRLYN